jgi:ribosomal protein S18 acetylase RimI-like enzyme
MKLRIEDIRTTDVSTVTDLMREFAAFENLEQYFEVTDESLTAAMFGENAFVRGLLSFDGDAAIGYALFFPYFASFRGQRGLYLEDIYVKQEYRGKGVGESMLKTIARIGADRGCQRIDFMVLDWNTPALKFYEKLGALRDDDERHFKFTNDAFKSLAR